MTIGFRAALPYRNRSLNRAANDLFKISSDQTKRGPLGAIVANPSYRLLPAKGGSHYPEYDDQTYFSHILNGIHLIGTLLDGYFGKHPDTPEAEQEKLARLTFSAFALHDLDKLAGRTGFRRLKEAVERDLDEYLPIVEPYLQAGGFDPQAYRNDLAWLILATEEGTIDEGNTLTTKLPSEVLSALRHYMKAGDKATSLKRLEATRFASRLREVLADLPPRLRSYEPSQIKTILIPRIPQAKLFDALRATLTRYLQGGEKERRFLYAGTEALLYLGPSLGEADEGVLTEELRESIQPLLKELIEGAQPSNSSLRACFDLCHNCEPTIEFVDLLVERYRHRLALWSGKVWRNSHPELHRSLGAQGIPLEKLQDGRFRLSFPDEYDEGGPTADQYDRARAVAVSCALRYLNKDEPLQPSDFPWFVEIGVDPNAPTLQSKTLRGFIEAARVIKELGAATAYDTLRSKFIEALKKHYPSRTDPFREVARELVAMVIQGPQGFGGGTPSVDLLNACFQCGERGEEILEAAKVFGYGATAAGIRKRTTLASTAKTKGRICRRCVVENSLRKQDHRGGKSSSPRLGLHVDLAPFTAPVTLQGFLSSLPHGERIAIDEEKLVIHLGKATSRDKLRFNLHALTFLNSPTSKEEEFWLLYRTLHFAHETGLKVTISPLLVNPQHHPEQFVWENAPGWVIALDFNRLRLDQIAEKLEYVKDLLTFRGLANNKIAPVVKALTGKGEALFTIAYRGALKGGKLQIGERREEVIRRHMARLKEAEKMTSMDQIVEPALKILNRAPVSNRENMWIIRTALETLKNARNLPPPEQVSRMAGALWVEAQRKDYYNQKEGQQACLEVAQRLLDYLTEYYEGQLPPSHIQKDLISHFALLYNMEAWKRFRERKKTNSNKKTTSEEQP